MDELIKMIVIPGDNLVEKINRNGQIDIILKNVKKEKNFKIITLNKEDIKEFNKQKINLKENDIDQLTQHFIYLREYLNKYFKRDTAALNLNLIPDKNVSLELTEKVISIINSKNHIIINNSDYATLLYLPPKITIEQFDSLNVLKDVFSSDKFFVLKSFEKPLDINNKFECEGTFDEVISNYINHNDYTARKKV